jgi:hypothetical protein
MVMAASVQWLVVAAVSAPAALFRKCFGKRGANGVKLGVIDIDIGTRIYKTNFF